MERFVDYVVPYFDFSMVCISDPKKIFVVFVILFWSVHDDVVEWSAENFMLFGYMSFLGLEKTVPCRLSIFEW